MARNPKLDKEFDKDRFSFLLEQAKGKRTQKEFAADIGLSTAYLNRYITGRMKTPPSPNVLAKISSVSIGLVTLPNLLDAAGYDPEKYVTLGRDEIVNFDLYNETGKNTIIKRLSKRNVNQITFTIKDILYTIDHIPIIGDSSKLTEEERKSLLVESPYSKAQLISLKYSDNPFFSDWDIYIYPGYYLDSSFNRHYINLMNYIIQKCDEKEQELEEQEKQGKNGSVNAKKKQGYLHFSILIPDVDKYGVLLHSLPQNVNYWISIILYDPFSEEVLYHNYINSLDDSIMDSQYHLNENAPSGIKRLNRNTKIVFVN